MPSVGRDLVAVELGAHRRQLLLLEQRLDPRLEVVVGGGEPAGLAHVARRAVGAGEAVQPREQRAGIRDVAAHRGVGPGALAVAVEAQVQLDQPRHRLGRLLVEAQRPQPLGDELGADHLVVVEGDAAAVLEPPGRRLADVVQQRGQAQHEVGAGHRLRWPAGRSLEVDGLLEHGHRVLVDVLVAVVLVDLELQGGQLGQHVVGQPADAVSSSRPARGCGASSSLTSSSRTRSAETISIVAAISRMAAKHLGGRHEAELRHEPRGAHHPQRVVAERHLGRRRACAAGRRRGRRGRRAGRRR